MNVLDPFKRFFHEADPQAQAIGECNEIIEFVSTPYYSRLIDYLERGADEPLRTESESSIIRSAERSNTFKEIKRHLQKQARDAQIVLDRERSDG